MQRLIQKCLIISVWGSSIDVRIGPRAERVKTHVNMIQSHY